MGQGVDPYEKLKHQVRFLHERGLASAEMQDLNRQLWVLERLSGKDPSKLDSHLRERLNGELQTATLAQLASMELVDAWLDAWEWRDAVPSSPDPSAVEFVEPPAISRSHSARGNAHVR